MNIRHTLRSRNPMVNEASEYESGYLLERMTGTDSESVIVC